MAITTHRYDTADALAGALADRLLDHVRADPQATLGLATGGTPTVIYEALAAKARAGDFVKARVFALDEYVGLPVDHPCSYHTYLRERVIGPLGLDPSRCHIPDGLSADRQGAAAAHEAAIAGAGGVDLWIVGIGHNGHIAFNEPGSSFEARTRDVALSETTRRANARFFPAGEEVPSHAITVGLGTLAEHARELLLVARGADKRDILHRAMHGPMTPTVPASLLQRLSVSAYCDAAALPDG